MAAPKKSAKPRVKTSAIDSVLGVVLDSKHNLDVAQTAAVLGRTPYAVYDLVKSKTLHPVRVGMALVFARTEIERYRANLIERECVKLFSDGMHPLDVYQQLNGRAKVQDVDRIMREWAKLAGVWLIEAPRGSYQRWLARFELLRVSPRGLRRFVEAMLSDPELEAKARSYFADQRVFNGHGTARLEERQKRRGIRKSALEPTADAND